MKYCQFGVFGVSPVNHSYSDSESSMLLNALARTLFTGHTFGHGGLIIEDQPLVNGLVSKPNSVQWISPDLTEKLFDRYINH